MKLSLQFLTANCTLLLITMGMVGCAHHHGNVVTADSPPPNGVKVDDIMMMQENNAEAAKYVVYEHEFVKPDVSDDGQVSGGWKLNAYGEDHVKQIAANLNRGDLYPIVVERSQISPDPDSTYQYPIHFNEDLDNQRRRVIVASLNAMGVEDADERVLVAPSFAEGITGSEGRRAYLRGINGRRNNGFGFGGAFGGFGWGGGFGF